MTEIDEIKPNALLIEDNAEDRLNIKLQLEVMGFLVFDVSSATEAREIFPIRDYSLALFILVMHLLRVSKFADKFVHYQRCQF